MNTPTLQERLTALFIDIQNQATLAMFDKTSPEGFFFHIDRTKNGDSLTCRVTSQNRMTTYAGFTISTMVTGGKALLQTRINSTVAETLSEAERYVKSLNIVMGVARTLDKTYCQSWNTAQ